MCGIAGVCGELPDKESFDKAVHTLAHRGPDDHGFYSDPDVSLGHRRLAIIDLSHAGRQPMKNNADNSVLVFNGEIYNYRELRKELEDHGHKFLTQSDTEVLLKAFEHWGLDSLGKLNGMWAFALWRPFERKLYVCRDRFGAKPFYYLMDSRRFAFASEPKALTSMYPEYRRVDQEALYRFLAEGNLYGQGRSFYEGIKVLPAAHCGTYDLETKEFHVKRYWHYPEHVDYDSSPEIAAEEFAAIFEDAVSLRLRSDVRVGQSLSGGLDSTSILAATHALGHQSLLCFTSGYEDPRAGEMEWARRAADRGGNVLITAQAKRTDWLDVLPKIAWHMDGPGYSPAVFPLWELMKAAKSNTVPVMLEGQGADELLGGYIAHAVANFTQLALSGIMRFSPQMIGCATTAWRGMERSHPRRRVIMRMGAQVLPWLLPYYRKRKGALSVLRGDFSRQFAGHGKTTAKLGSLGAHDWATQRLRYDHEYAVLPGLLHYGDAISMAHGIEARDPFLDYRLVEWGFRQPALVKFNEGETKWPERNYLRSRNWSDFGDRWDKKGYPTPTDAWMKENYAELPRRILLAPSAKIKEYCVPSLVDRLLNSYAGGDRASENHIYRLLSTEFWLQSCL